MKVSLNWLKDYIDITESPEEIGQLLTLHIAEVDEIHYQAKGLDHIVVGLVLEARPHPDANKLNIGKFDVGEAEPRQIVFGGKAELKAGDRLPVALPGAVVGPITIEQRKLRGEISQGMCCLNSEMGILDSQDRVHFFDETAKPGTPISEALQLDDVVFEIDNKTLTHRADLFNHIGFARELSTLLQRPLRLPELNKDIATTNSLPYTLNVQNPAGCTRYLGAAFDSVEIKPSPDWMQKRLSALGVSVINNVVDITNYVMYEYGQPLHAFDYNKLSNGTVTVRNATNNEPLTTLDGKLRALDESILVIADDTKPVALAGIMGGLDSEIESTTTQLALESAQFDGTIIRKAAQKIGVRTDGSTRHEKGLGYTFSEDGFWRAVQLLREHAGATLASEVIDTQPVPPALTTIDLSKEYMDRVIGLSIEPNQIRQWLEALGCEIKNLADEHYEITVPLHRTDLRSAQDIIEEVARMYGYDSIPEVPLLGSLQPPFAQPDFALGNKIMQWLVGWGVIEVYNYSFYSIADAKKANVDTEQHIEIRNPMNPNQQLLRQTALIGLLNNVARNVNAGYKAITLAEYGHLYFKGKEITVVEGVVANQSDAFYKAKGYIEAILQTGNIVYSFENMRYIANGECVAEVALIPNAATTEFDVQVPVAHYRIYLEQLSKIFPSRYSQKMISAYPAIDLDISITVPNTVQWADIRSVIQSTAGDILQNIEIFDVYEGNLGIRMWFQSSERTLEMKEVEAIREKIIKSLVDSFNIVHRY